MGEINEISSKYYQEEKINVIQWNKLKYKYNIQDYLFLKIFFIYYKNFFSIWY